MGRLDRYLAKEILLPFGAALLFLTQLLLATQLFARADLLFGAGVGLADLAGVVLAITPNLVGYVLPVSFLLGAVLGVGRLADDREVMAIGAAGLSPVRLVRAPLLLGAAVALLGLWSSTELEPLGLRDARLRFNEIIKRNVAANVRSGTFFDEIPLTTVYAERAGPGGWENVLVADGSDPASPVLALAREGRLTPVGAGEGMQLTLTGGELHRQDTEAGEYLRATFERASVSLGLGTAISDRNVLSGSNRELTAGQLLDASRPAPGRTEKQRRTALIAYHRRLASPLVVLAFALVAVPVAALRRGGRAAAVGATVGGALAHYLLLRGGEVLAEREVLPPALSLHLANAVLAVLGLGLLWVLARRGPEAVR